MSGFEGLLKEATVARRSFEQGSVPPVLLKKLYLAYNPDVEIDSFLDAAASMFPRLNCGLASVYVQYRIQDGEVVHGSYDGQGHTFVALGGLAIVDITADQFGGPAVYAGPIVSPWSLQQV